MLALFLVAYLKDFETKTSLKLIIFWNIPLKLWWHNRHMPNGILTILVRKIEKPKIHAI